MPEINGENIALAIERLTARRLTDARATRDRELSGLADQFFDRFEVPAQSRKLGPFYRSIRKLDDEGLRYFRSLSDILLHLNEQDLWRIVTEFRRQVDGIDSAAHQEKTQASFVGTVLRPFNNKYRLRWITERGDEFNAEEFEKRIFELEIRRIDTVEELYQWGYAVEEFFFDFVVHKGEGLGPRPYGTVGSRSARTYVQAWSKLMKEHAQEILELGENPYGDIDSGINLNQGQDEPDDFSDYSERRPSELKTHDALKSYASPKPSRSRRDSNMRFSLARSTDFSFEAPGFDKAVGSFANDVPNVPGVEQKPLIAISIESKIDSSAKSSKKWKSERDFQSAIEGWVQTLPVLWGDAATQLLAKVSINGQDGESDITLPSLSPGTAAEVIRSAVSALINS